MIEGLVLGLLAWASILFSGLHLPNWLKRFFIKKIVLTDILTTGLTWLLIGSFSHSLVAVIGCVSSGLLMNFTMSSFKYGLLPMPAGKASKDDKKLP